MLYFWGADPDFVPTIAHDIMQIFVSPPHLTENPRLCKVGDFLSGH